MLRLILYEWRQGGPIRTLLFLLFSAVTIALPLSGAFAATWTALQKGGLLWVLLPLLSIALLLWAQRPEILRTRNLVALALVRFVALSVLIFLVVVGGDAVTDSLAPASTSRRTLYDGLLRSQAALTVILLAWRFASGKPNHADSLRPVLARAGKSARRLWDAPFHTPDDVDKYNEIQAGFSAAIEEVLKTLPSEDSPVHPWEAGYLADLKHKADDAKKVVGRASANVYTAIRGQDSAARQIVKYWTRFK